MKKITIFIILMLIAIAGVICFIYYRKASQVYEYEAVMLYLPHGTTEEAFGDSLEAVTGKEFAGSVMALWQKLPGENVVKSGAYMIEPGQKALDVAKRLKHGQQTPVKVTFNNIRTLDNLAERVAAQMEFSEDEFLAVADSLASAEGISRKEVPALFLPDTFEAYWNESPHKFIARLKSHYDKFWNDERLGKAKAMNMTPIEVSTVASIVEEETNKADERPKVARLYLNRLKKGMKLQADPTVKFAVGDFTLRRITGEHLKVKSPYNTYLFAGLPPGPIRIPEAKTIDGVLNAPMHNYIYMCAKEDFSGYHNFATDYATHRENARRYQKALDARGIK